MQLGNKKWGTIKVKRISYHHVPLKPIAKKRQGIRVFLVRFNGSDYKETFPASYESELFPLVFNGAGLILTDENKQWSKNNVRGYDYEVFIGNTSALKAKPTNFLDLNYVITSLKRGEYIWIKNLYYSDIKGAIQINKIGEFKVEKIR